MIKFNTYNTLRFDTNYTTPHPSPITNGTPHLHPKIPHIFRLIASQNSCFPVFGLMPPIPPKHPYFHLYLRRWLPSEIGCIYINFIETTWTSHYITRILSHNRKLFISFQLITLIIIVIHVITPYQETISLMGYLWFIAPKSVYKNKK